MCNGLLWVKETDIQGTAPVYIFPHTSCVQLFEYRFEPDQKIPNLHARVSV